LARGRSRVGGNFKGRKGSEMSQTMPTEKNTHYTTREKNNRTDLRKKRNLGGGGEQRSAPPQKSGGKVGVWVRRSVKEKTCEKRGKNVANTPSRTIRDVESAGPKPGSKRDDLSCEGKKGGPGSHGRPAQQKKKKKKKKHDRKRK